MRSPKSTRRRSPSPRFRSAVVQWMRGKAGTTTESKATNESTSEKQGSIDVERVRKALQIFIKYMPHVKEYADELKSLPESVTEEESEFYRKLVPEYEDYLKRRSKYEASRKINKDNPQHLVLSRPTHPAVEKFNKVKRVADANTFVLGEMDKILQQYTTMVTKQNTDSS